MRRTLGLLLLVVLVASAVAAFAGRLLWGRIQEPYKGYSADEQFVDVPPGSSAPEIGRRLIDAGIVRDTVAFRTALWWTGQARSLKAGEYRFDRPLSAVDAVGVVARGDTYGRPITFPEGLTIGEMGRVYEARGFGPARDFVKAAENAALIGDLDPGARDLEGYLFPETYALPRGSQPATLVAMMVDRFRAAYADSLRPPTEEQELTTRQIVTLASLVEKETAKAEERPLVAAVYRNRLKIGMPMQADPTVVYALLKAGRYDGNIRRDDLQIDSPYNTYRYAGLPPGPIASPGRAALEASFAPADTRNLYFVSRNDGSHVFAETLTEHNANVRKFQVEFFRQQRQAARARGAARRSVRSP